MNIVNIFLFLFCISFAISYLIVAKELKKTNFAFIVLFEEYSNLKQQSNIELDKNEDDLHKENFIKFLSDSRDWAYEYIETTQNSIQEVITDLNNAGLKNQADKLSKLLPEISND
jgi:predicted membrane protein